MKKIVPAPYIDQTARWVNGCESISSVMLLQAVGIPIDPDVFIERDLPHAPYWKQEGRLYGPDPMFVYPATPRPHRVRLLCPLHRRRPCRARWSMKERRTGSRCWT